MSNLDRIRNEKGQLPAFAWPGGYPVLYLTKDGLTICPECANRETDQSQAPIDYDVFYEGAPWSCDDCGTEIESAYGDPNDEEEDK